MIFTLADFFFLQRLPLLKSTVIINKIRFVDCVQIPFALLVYY